MAPIAIKPILSDRGKAHVEIQKREEESTTNQEGWLAVNLEDEDKEVYDMSSSSLNNQDTTQVQEAATHSTNLEASKAWTNIFNPGIKNLLINMTCPKQHLNQETIS